MQRATEEEKKKNKRKEEKKRRRSEEDEWSGDVDDHRSKKNGRSMTRENSSTAARLLVDGSMKILAWKKQRQRWIDVES